MKVVSAEVVTTFLDLIDKTIVLRVEHVMHGRQTDVLVAASVARSKMCVEQLVVVEAGSRGKAARNIVEIGRKRRGRSIRIVVEVADRRCSVRDVVQERVVGANCQGCVDRR